jgi:hypothetical protein
MTAETTATRPPTSPPGPDEGLVLRYAHANPPLGAGQRLPAIPDEFVAALELVDGHDPAAFRQVLADYNIDDAAALIAILRVVRHYGATAALASIGSQID